MKIERRITPNRRDKQASEELRNNSPVKLATFPSFYLFLFLSFFFFYVRCFSQTRTTSILLFRASRLKLFSFFSQFYFFPFPPPLVRRFRYSPTLLSSVESSGKLPLVDALFSCKQAPRERKLANLRATFLPTLVQKHTGRKC